ncbi:threonine/homoserine efflux transporter RhtA [Gillisia mitskevichiae]|uniref:Threonine/homoserine efflux transporter RhtA n=1 Tax=Gillisia mitskevichiae TaxID=270921 RepID=A0A495PWD9_9FLAO|nr:EamA family transporter [Gillisia mitskevichiae]RKS53059.1 threonine/homoserine efflux transporter RhtA [Gillisia mitskevichiae]
MNKKAIYAIIICAILAGANGLLIKSMTSLSTGTIAWFRTGIPILILIPFLWKNGELHFKGDNKKMLLASLINAARMYLYLLAYIYTSIGNTVVLFYTYPIFVTIIEVLFFKQKIERKQTLLLLLAFTGIVITYIGKPFSFQSDDFIGMLAAVGASIGYAITVVLFKAENSRYSKNQMVFYQNIVGAIVFIPFLTAIPSATVTDLGIGVFYGFLIGIVVFKLFFYGLQQLSAATATTLMYLEVVSAILLGYFVLDEPITWNILLGGSLIVTSSYLISRLNKKTTKVVLD